MGAVEFSVAAASPSANEWGEDLAVVVVVAVMLVQSFAAS
jgi:hypothetical protein